MAQRFQFAKQLDPNSIMQPFVKACEKIESDANYQPDINNEALMNLVVDEKGNARHSPRRSALAIKAPIAYREGFVYPILIAKKGTIDPNDEYPVWHIDDSIAILVNRKGELSLHETEKNATQNFSCPLLHLSANDFLGCPSLHSTKPELEHKSAPSK